MNKYLVTGAAGFIGMHVVEHLMDLGNEVVGLDNINDYYDPALKLARLNKILSRSDAQKFAFHRMDIADHDSLQSVFRDYDFNGVIHLAAQAGVRHSISNPQSYVQSNLIGFVNVLEAVRSQRERRACADMEGLSHLVYASSSSVYGGNTKTPFCETDRVDSPISLYAATKRSNELIAHTYSHLFGIPATGLRFFTAYGPWGRPDMSYFLFVKAITEGNLINVYNHGEMRRDFTYVDDIVKQVVTILCMPPTAHISSGTFSDDVTAPHRILNVGCNNPVPLLSFISSIERALGLAAKLNLQPLQPGDVINTHADTSRLQALTGSSPATPLNDGIDRFVRWYRQFYNLP